jgi:hypothetical protein
MRARILEPRQNKGISHSCVVELDFVRHVQGGVDGGTVVAPIALSPLPATVVTFFVVKSNRRIRLLSRSQKIQRTIRPDDDAVRVVYLRVEIAWQPGAENRGDGAGRHVRRRQDAHHRDHRTGSHRRQYIPEQ